MPARSDFASVVSASATCASIASSRFARLRATHQRGSSQPTMSSPSALSNVTEKMPNRCVTTIATAAPASATAMRSARYSVTFSGTPARSSSTSMRSRAAGETGSRSTSGKRLRRCSRSAERTPIPDACSGRMRVRTTRSVAVTRWYV